MLCPRYEQLETANGNDPNHIQMGTTGASDEVSLNSALPDIVSRIKEYTSAPLAVGFGVSTREHFNVVVDAGAEGVVVGSRLVSVIKQAPSTQVAAKVEEYCRSLSLKGEPPQQVVRTKSTTQATKSAANVDSAESLTSKWASDTAMLPTRFGQFGGQYVPEALFDCLIELEKAHNSAMADPEFWKEWEGLFKYMNRPSNLYFAENLTKHAGGAKIWMKREDLFAFFVFEEVASSDMPLAITRDHTRSIMPLAKSYSLAGSERSALLPKREPDNMELRQPLSAHVLVWNVLSTWVRKTFAARH
jgi:hypothetical protein